MSFQSALNPASPECEIRRTLFMTRERRFLSVNKRRKVYMVFRQPIDSGRDPINVVHMLCRMCLCKCIGLSLDNTSARSANQLHG